MIHGATTPDLANYARDDDDLVSRDDSEEMNTSHDPCPLVERTATLESEVWSETVEFPKNEDVTPISSSTQCRSRARSATKDTIEDPFSSPSIAVNAFHEEKILFERAHFSRMELQHLQSIVRRLVALYTICFRQTTQFRI